MGSAVKCMENFISGLKKQSRSSNCNSDDNEDNEKNPCPRLKFLPHATTSTNMLPQLENSIESENLFFSTSDELLLYPLVDRIGTVDFKYTDLFSMEICKSRTNLDISYSLSCDLSLECFETHDWTESLAEDSCNSQELIIKARESKLTGGSQKIPCTPDMHANVEELEDDHEDQKWSKFADSENNFFASLAVNKNKLLPKLDFGLQLDELGNHFVYYHEDQYNQVDSEDNHLNKELALKEDDYYNKAVKILQQEKINKNDKMSHMLQLLMKEPEFVEEEFLDNNHSDVIDLLKDKKILKFSKYLNSEFNSSKSQFKYDANNSRGTQNATSQWTSKVKILDINKSFASLVPNPAILYEFEMDEFQKTAVYHLEMGNSVFVAAHTSAGKTVVAEYAIALSLRHGTRSIYTSPIKALSNQKYRDFCKTFGDQVGLVTGDISVNSEAPCLIVTTEILRNMLYKGADVIRDVEWIIFDEIHYINDHERGVVWEEVIIMLPNYVNLVFLSATVQNTLEFAEWVGLTKKKVINIVEMDKRPVPLEHHVYHNRSLFKLADDKNFYEENFKYLRQHYETKTGKSNKNQSRNIYAIECNETNKLVKLLKTQNLMPAIFFVFSKNKCFQLASSINSVMVSSAEAQKIKQFIDSSINKLRPFDRALPQITKLRSILISGVGVHHSGLIPIMKEIVEILFSKSLIKILFSTETFAMGVNMPAKAVVFNSLRKVDNDQSKRLLTTGEYIQMSGRAGRRGIDKVGVVIIMTFDTLYDLAELREVVKGYRTLLVSKFKISYNMILNLLKTSGEFRIGDMIRRSFSEVNVQKKFDYFSERLSKFQNIYDTIEPVNCEFGVEHAIEDYYNNFCSSQSIKKNIYNLQMKKNLSSVLSNGRILLLKDPSTQRLLYALVCTSPGNVSIKLKNSITLLVLNENYVNKDAEQYYVTNVPLDSDQIELVTNLKISKFNAIKFIKKDADYIARVIREMRDIRTKHLKSLLPPFEVRQTDMNDESMALLLEELRINQNVNSSIPCNNCYLKTTHFEQHYKRAKLKEHIEALKYVMSDENIRMVSEYQVRIKILQKLNYINEEGQIQLKGRVAREMSCCDELLGTEIIFQGILSDLEPDELASLLSALVYKNSKENTLKSIAFEPLSSKVLSIAKKIVGLQIDCGLDVSIKDYVESILNFGLMEVVYDWCNDVPFKDIMKKTNVSEGIIVKFVLRLNEILKDFKNATHLIGDVELEGKITVALGIIRRDIAFSSSLYISDASYSTSDGSALEK